MIKDYYLSRDKDGELALFNIKPKKGTSCWYYETHGDGTRSNMAMGHIPEECISEELRGISWEDDPVKVNLKIEKE